MGAGEPFGSKEAMLDDEVQQQIAVNRALTLRGFAMSMGPLIAVFVVGLVLVPFLGAIVLVVPVVAAAACGGVWWLFSHADQRALSLAGAVPADEAAHSRLFNIIDGLCASTGIARPSLYVVDRPDANAFAVDARRQPSIVVTSGLLDQLRPVELEGLLAQQLCHIKVNDTVVGALATVFPPLRAQLPDSREWLADRGAIAITRYPPGLIGALDRILADSATATAAAALAHLWTGPPGVSSAALELRIDALREL